MTTVETRRMHIAPKFESERVFLINGYSFWRSALNMHLRFGGDITCTKQERTSQIPVQTSAQLWKRRSIAPYAKMLYSKTKRLVTG
jgi:CYTH domain-containing protein